MANHASVNLIGHLGKDPETRHTQSGDAVTSFSLATTVKRKDQDITTWWNCTAWGKRGEIAQQYLHKGDPVHIQGEPMLRTYQTQDGRNGQALEVTVSALTLLGSKNGSHGAQVARSASAGQPAQSSQRADSRPDYDDDIPF